MSFTDKLQALAERIPGTLEHLATEEATKTALIMPFIAALGYDVFNPTEVVPEFTADVATKKGEKVDYAIKHNGEVIMLFEAKKATESLGHAHAGQLFRYFSVTQATRIAVLTNGVVYQFYSDIDAPNRMDEKPFLVIDMMNLQDDLVAQLEKLTKESFDLDGMLEAAGDLKYIREIRRVFDRQFKEPDDDFVRFFFAQACPGRNFVQSAKEHFAGLVTESLRQVIVDRVNARLRSALEGEVPAAETSAPNQPETEEEAPGENEDGIQTTEEELEGYRIVKAIVCSVLPAERIAYRDAKSYFSILVDDNNRKPICRLHFNRTRKYVGTFDEHRNETRHALESLDEIYQLSDALRDAAGRYVETPSAPNSSTDDGD